MAGTRISREIGGNAWRGRVFRENYVGMNGGGRFFSRNSWECMVGARISRELRGNAGARISREIRVPAKRCEDIDKKKRI